MQSFQFHLLAAKRVMLIDAHMDDFPSYRLVQCVERLKGVGARWIRNSFIRQPGYSATLHVCRSDVPAEHAEFKDAAIDTVLR